MNWLILKWSHKDWVKYYWWIIIIIIIIKRSVKECRRQSNEIMWCFECCFLMKVPVVEFTTSILSFMFCLSTQLKKSKRETRKSQLVLLIKQKQIYFIFGSFACKDFVYCYKYNSFNICCHYIIYILVLFIINSNCCDCVDDLFIIYHS